MTAPVTALKRTLRRQRLGAAVAAGKVKHFHHVRPVSRWEDVAGGVWSTCTAEVARWVAAGLAEVVHTEPGDYSVVRLTDAGLRWLTDAGGTP